MCPRAARALAPRLLALGALLWPAAGAWTLTILHTNDVHSRLEQTSEDASKCVSPGRCVGGVARLSTQVRRLRSAEPHVLLLDAGDQYQGTLWFTVYRGAEVAHFMNALGYDAMVSGWPTPRPRSPWGSGHGAGSRGGGGAHGLAPGGQPAPGSEGGRKASVPSRDRRLDDASKRVEVGAPTVRFGCVREQEPALPIRGVNWGVSRLGN